MAYGGPTRLDQVEAYLLDVRGSRPSPPEAVAEVRARYARIGGGSPLLARTEAQARALQAALDRCGPGFEVHVGMRHWHPYIADALRRLAERGVREAVGVVMAPHYSAMSIGAYYRAVEDARSGITVRGIQSWHLLPGYLATVADHVRAAIARFPDAAQAGAAVIFTAHSLPERIRTWNDPYPLQLAETVAAVMAQIGPRPHRFAYQSASPAHEPWLGPDVTAVLAELGRAGARHVVVAPIGFVTEHVEILYDLDIALRERAASLGVQLERIAMPEEAAPMIDGLATLVRAAAREAGWT
jgi:ferrochelatase